MREISGTIRDGAKAFIKREPAYLEPRGVHKFSIKNKIIISKVINQKIYKNE